MFENIAKFFRKLMKSENKESGSKDAAKERLHLVLMQDRANVSADFLELMKQEIIEVIKKYIEVDEKEIDVRLTNKENDDGTNGAPALYANIPILNIKNEMKKEVMAEQKEEIQQENKEEDTKQTENTEESKEMQTNNENKNDESVVNLETENNAEIIENKEENESIIQQKNEDIKETQE